MKKPFFIIAQDYKQARQFLSKYNLNPHDFIIANDPDLLRGVNSGTLIRVGHYYHNLNYDSVLYVARSRQMDLIHEKEFISYIEKEYGKPN
jgi:hypothetical protein